MGNCIERTEVGGKENPERRREMAKVVDELTYFNLKGRGETLRVLYTVAGKEFRENRLEYGSEEWQKMKPDVLYGTLPMMKRGDVTFNQTIAIARLIARENNLVGDDLVEQTLEDAVVDKVEELGNRAADILLDQPDPERKEIDWKRFTEEILPPGLACLERALASNNKSKYFVGSRIKWCDIHMFCVAERFVDSYPNILDPYPNLKSHYAMIKAHPGVAKWISMRPKEW